MEEFRGKVLPKGEFGKEIAAGFVNGMGLISSIVVVPTLLFQSGMDFTGAYTAFLVTAVCGTLLAGRVTGQPMVLVPGIPLALWLVYGEIVSRGIAWQSVLGAAFLASVVGVLLLVSPLRTAVMDAVPEVLRQAMVSAVGLLLVMQGLMQGRLLVGSPFSVTMLGNLSDPVAYLSLVGIGIIFVLLVNGVPYALAVGTLSVAAIAFLQGFWVIPDAPFLVPEGLNKTVLQLDLGEGFLWPGIWLPMLLFVLMESIGTLQAFHGACPEQMDPPSRRALLCILGMGALGAFLGSLPSRIAPESVAGMTLGGCRRAAYGTVLFLLLMLFCEPLAKEAASFGAIAAPAMMGAGFFMLRSLKGWVRGDAADLASALCLVVLVPLSRDVAAGLGISLIAHVLLKLFCGKCAELCRGECLMAIFFAMYFFFG